MPKKPFSGKQKKQQLAEKRERKRDGVSSLYSDDIESEGQYPGKEDGDVKEAVSLRVAKVNQQPVATGLGTKYDPNRYRLHFHRESKEVLQKRKQASFEPIQPVGEQNLEMDLEKIYRPGTVLDMPIRPSWNYSMTKQELDAREERFFHQYVEKIFNAHQDSDDLSYFELNLETWRQLWRVIEMSDVLFVIVDLRFPILHFPPTLYKYIAQEIKKPMILILNKIDFVPAELATAWKKYFEETYPGLNVVLFGSSPRAAVDVRETFKKKKPTKRKSQVCFGDKEIFQICEKLTGGKVDMSEWKERIYHQETVVSTKKTGASSTQAKTSTDDRLHPLDYQPFKDGMLTIGCIGEPNVGKSSVINALMGQKVVSVSRTPGHTKHFQTIFLARNVRLCDSPGLVFPATAPKVLQILGGIYPISQVQDPVSVIGYLAARVPVVELLNVKHPDNTRNKGEFSAMDICEAWAIKRGFMTAKAARPDTYRAANHLLRVTLEGKIIFRMYPPGFVQAKSSYEKLPDTKELKNTLEKLEARLTGNVGDTTKESEAESEEESDEEDSDVEPDQDGEGEDVESEDEHENSGQAAVSSNPFAALADVND